MKKYEVYKKVRPMEEYFSTWDKNNVAALTEMLKRDIYEKYVVKCKVFQRDNFTCQNLNCKTPDGLLTMHHVKWKKNGGDDKVRNGVTLCKACHAGFHKARISLVFADEERLPSNLRGHTFQITLPEPQVNWKRLRIEMKAMRKSMKQAGFKPTITWDQIAVMMAWLLGYTEDDEFDD